MGVCRGTMATNHLTGRIHYDRHRTIVYQLDLHVRSKLSRRHPNPKRPQIVRELLIKRLGNIRVSGVNKAGASAFLTVAVESELANYQNAAARVLNADIHLALGIGKDAQTRNFVREPTPLLRRVGDVYAEEDQQSAVDLADDHAIDRYQCPLNALNNRPHR